MVVVVVVAVDVVGVVDVVVEVGRVAAFVVGLMGGFVALVVEKAVEAVFAPVTGASEEVEKPPKMLLLLLLPPKIEGSSPPQVISHSPKVSNLFKLPRHPP